MFNVLPTHFFQFLVFCYDSNLYITSGIFQFWETAKVALVIIKNWGKKFWLCFLSFCHPLCPKCANRPRKITKALSNAILWERGMIKRERERGERERERE